MSREWSMVGDREKAIIEPFLDDAPVKIVSMARELGLDVKAATLRPRISGQILKSETSEAGYRIRVNRREHKARRRFTVAHELAHYLLHRDRIGDGIEDSILYRSTLSNRREAEANRLAADLLMPEKKILEVLGGYGGDATPEIALEMADQFNVSEAAMSIRLGLR